MSIQTERLERAAAQERELLGEYLDQLQHKLEKVLDPAALFDRYPLPILATALVGGVVLGAVTRSDEPSRRHSMREESGRSRGGMSQRGGFMHDGIAQLRGALLGMLFAKIAEKVQDFTNGRAEDEVVRPRKRPSVRTAERARSHGDASGDS